MTKIIVVFNSNHETLFAEKLFKEQEIPIRPIIKPRRISSNCALALEFEIKYQTQITRICETDKLFLVGFFRKQNEEWVKI